MHIFPVTVNSIFEMTQKGNENLILPNVDAGIHMISKPMKFQPHAHPPEKSLEPKRLLDRNVKT